MLRFLDVPIWDTGLVLVLINNGTLLIERSPLFVPFFDQIENGVNGIFLSAEFGLKEAGAEDYQWYDYGTAYMYKEMPTLKAWLVQQQMELN